MEQPTAISTAPSIEIFMLGCYVAAQRAFLGVINQYEAARCLAAIAKLLLARRAPDDGQMAHIAQVEAQHIFEQLGAA